MTERRVLDLQAELRADEAAARGELDAAEAALAEAEAAVAPALVDADPDEVRRRAVAVDVTRSAATVEHRTLGPRPDFDEIAERATLDVLRAMDDADAATRAARRDVHLLLGAGNVLGAATIGHAAFRMIVLTADPASAAMAATVLVGGSFPIVAAALGAARVLWVARQAGRLRPDLDAALRAGGCVSVDELADRREAFERWRRRARLAAEAGDRCALAERDWYELAGACADPGDVEDLLARAEWCRVTRVAVERARLAHRIAASRVARAEVLATGGEPPEGGEPEHEPASDRIQIALLRLRRGARLSWRRAS